MGPLSQTFWHKVSMDVAEVKEQSQLGDVHWGSDAFDCHFCPLDMARPRFE